jgi:hypothetical protein
VSPAAGAGRRDGLDVGSAEPDSTLRAPGAEGSRFGGCLTLLASDFVTLFAVAGFAVVSFALLFDVAVPAMYPGTLPARIRMSNFDWGVCLHTFAHRAAPRCRYEKRDGLPAKSR